MKKSVKCSRLSMYNFVTFLSQEYFIQHNFSILALVRFPGPLLLVVFLRVLTEMEMIRSAHRVMGMDIDLGSHFSETFSFPSEISKATVRMVEHQKLSTCKLITFYSSNEKRLDHITLIKIELRRSPKQKVLAWRNSRLHGS